MRLIPVALFLASFAAASAADIPRHTRFEASFTSAKDYANPFQDVRVTVTFTHAAPPSGSAATSPRAQTSAFTHTVDAFWDGERTWRVRFSPEALGDWSFTTTATVTTASTTGSTNPTATPAPGLHAQSGTFRCVPYNGDNPLYRHGPLRVSKSQTHLEHADATPFFWLADTCWAGALLSQPDDWSRYLADRRAKRFTAVQFMATQNVAAAADAQGRQAYTDKEKIVLDPWFFRRLDHRVDALNAAGLIAAPTFAWAAQYMLAARQLDPGAFLPDDQLIALGRYVVARYGAHQLVWLFAGDYDYRPPEVAERWRQLGRAIFNHNATTPSRLVTVHPAPRLLGKTEFGREPWMSFYGYQSGHSSGDSLIKWITQTGPAAEWSSDPLKPVINLEPIYEAHNNGGRNRLATALDVRQASWWSVLATPVAGVSYGAHGVWSWETQPAVPSNHPRTGLARPWHEAIALPGSTHLKILRDVLESVPWIHLRPAPSLLTAQPGSKNIQHHVAAAQTSDHRTTVLYFPSSSSATLDLSSFPASPTARWLDPTTGQPHSASPLSVTPSAALEFTPPGPNAAGDPDWLLLLN